LSNVMTSRWIKSTYIDNESRRKFVRKKLAAALNLNFKDVTLSNLINIIPEEKKQQLRDTKAKLSSLAQQLKREYAATAMLLSDCARFNNFLLNSLFNSRREETVTYTSAGSAKRQTEAVFMDLQF